MGTETCSAQKLVPECQVRPEGQLPLGDSEWHSVCDSSAVSTCLPSGTPDRASESLADGQPRFGSRWESVVMLEKDEGHDGELVCLCKCMFMYMYR